MEEQVNESIKNSKKLWIIVATSIFITFLITVVIAWAWQMYSFDLNKQKYQSRENSLQSRIDDLQQDNYSLQNQIALIKENQNTPTPQDPQKYQLINNKCTYGECLFSNSANFPAGVATIKGYYTKYLDGGYLGAGIEEEYCDSITITGGNKEIIDSLIRRVDEGNTVHDKNDLNQPIVNLDLNESDKQKFLNSTKDSPIELVIFSPVYMGQGVPLCFSAFNILEVK